MKRSIHSWLLILALFFSCSKKAEVTCYEGTVVGEGSCTGDSVFIIQINNAERIGENWMNKKNCVSCIKLPAAFQETGKKVFFQLRKTDTTRYKGPCLDLYLSIPSIYIHPEAFDAAACPNR